MTKKFLYLLAVALIALFALAMFALVMTEDTQAHFGTGCKKAKCKRHVVAPYQSQLRKMHGCEMRGRVGEWHYDGFYDGGLQFGVPTWQRTGSRYLYAWQAPVLEQKYRAVIWAWKINWQWRSTAGWPNCG